MRKHSSSSVRFMRSTKPLVRGERTLVLRGSMSSRASSSRRGGSPACRRTPFRCRSGRLAREGPARCRTALAGVPKNRLPIARSWFQRNSTEGASVESIRGWANSSRLFAGEVRGLLLETPQRVVGRRPKQKPGQTPTGEADARGHRHRIGIPAGEAPPDARKLNGGREVR